MSSAYGGPVPGGPGGPTGANYPSLGNMMYNPHPLGNYLASAAALPFLLNANSSPNLLGHPCFHHIGHSWFIVKDI